MTSDSDIVDQVLTLQDGALHFAQSGHGSLLVLLHGSLCDYRYWRWQLPELSRAHTVVAPSLRGYWPQAHQHEDARFSIERHAADIIEPIARLSRGNPVHLLGQSRGARVALEVALRAPDSLASLMLADPGFRFEGDPQTTTLGPDIATLLQSDDPDAALAAFVDAVNGPDTWRRMVRWFKTMVSDNRGTL